MPLHCQFPRGAHGRRTIAVMAMLIVGAVGITPRPAAAQSRWSADAALAFGTSHGGIYRVDDANVASGVLALGYAFRRTSGTAYTIGLARTAPWDAGTETAVCEIDPRGGCLGRPPFAQLTALQLGVRQRLVPRVEVGASLGSGIAYAPGAGSHPGFLAGVTAAFRVVGPIWIDTGVESLWWSVRGDAMRMPGWSLGLRWQP